MNTSAPAPVPGDDGDWTFVIIEDCDECGFWPFESAESARRITDGTARWREVLDRSAWRTVGILQSVPAGGWDRTGHRSDGLAFTIASLGQYIGHEMEYHLHDVRV